MRQDEAKHVEEQIRGIEESIWTKGKVIWTRPAGMPEGLKIWGGGSSNVVGIFCPPTLVEIGLADLTKFVGQPPPCPPGSAIPVLRGPGSESEFWAEALDRGRGRIHVG